MASGGGSASVARSVTNDGVVLAAAGVGRHVTVGDLDGHFEKRREGAQYWVVAGC
jgi:hypothetical protein